MTATAPLYDIDRLPRVDEPQDIGPFFLALRELGIVFTDPDDLFTPLKDERIPFTARARQNVETLMHLAYMIAGDDTADCALNPGKAPRPFDEYFAKLRTPETPVTNPDDLEFARALAVLFEQETVRECIVAGLRDGTLRILAACHLVGHDSENGSMLASAIAEVFEPVEREGW